MSSSLKESLQPAEQPFSLLAAFGSEQQPAAPPGGGGANLASLYASRRRIHNASLYISVNVLEAAVSIMEIAFSEFLSSYYSISWLCSCLD